MTQYNETEIIIKIYRILEQEAEYHDGLVGDDNPDPIYVLGRAFTRLCDGFGCDYPTVLSLVGVTVGKYGWMRDTWLLGKHPDYKEGDEK